MTQLELNDREGWLLLQALQVLTASTGDRDNELGALTARLREARQQTHGN